MNDIGWQQRPMRAVSAPLLLTPEQCDAVRQDAFATGFAKAIARDADGNAYKNKIRSYNFARLPRKPERDWLYDLILAKTEEVNRENWRFAVTDIEDVVVNRYRPTKRAKWHFDIYIGSERKIICVTNLSPPESYWRGGLQVRGRHENRAVAALQGSATWFPAYMEHRARAPWWGERFSMIAILTGPAWV